MVIDLKGNVDLMRLAKLVLATVVLPTLAFADASRAPNQNWTHYVRIGAYGLRSDNAEAIARDAQKSHVFGIEVDNDIPGRYESFLDPTQKLKDIRAAVEAAHRVGNKAFVYIAGTECITANAEKSPHSLAKDHPDWLQRNLKGEPAVFTSGAAFWISPGDEDVWVSPLATEWRKLYMERVRQIAATGIDGIYVDIPYWMTHFDGWENTWASFDNYTVAAFKKSTGLDARRDLKLGDFSDANFRRWVDFRIGALTDFVRDIRDTARAVNPTIMVIPEIYPGIEEEAVRVGADVYQMYGVVDAIAHEYEFGAGDHMASSRTQLDWFLYQAGMLSLRAFAQGKATWILNYSWDGDKEVDAREAMKNLAMSQVMAGVNVWDAPGHSMAGTNDVATRTEIFQWIEQHEKIFYRPRIPMHPVGVYFSPTSRNYNASQFLPSFRGTLLLLLQKHLEFQVVTPRSLASFHGEVLVLPNVSTLAAAEKVKLQTFVSKGGRLVVTGTDGTGFVPSPGIARFPECPGRAYLAALEEDFAKGSSGNPKEFLAALGLSEELRVEASPLIAANIAAVEGKPHIFLANFAGLVPHKVAVPSPQTGVRISVPAERNCTLRFLPFLGELQTLMGQRAGDRSIFILPPVERGAAVWIEDRR
jgi:endo-alpha-1,4-polygalactosaminidase (GH114 family)